MVTLGAALAPLIRERTPKQRALSGTCRFLSVSFFSLVFVEGIRAVKARSVSFAGVGGVVEEAENPIEENLNTGSLLAARRNFADR